MRALSMSMSPTLLAILMAVAWKQAFGLLQCPWNHVCGCWDAALSLVRHTSSTSHRFYTDNLQTAHLVTPGTACSYLLDRDFTLGALAFLCSRLLSASKHARAATTLQRAWRARLAERDNHRRAIAKHLATHCAAVVQTRNEILWAKEVITRWWRASKARKQRQNTARSQPTRKPSHRMWKTAGRRL